MSPSSSSSSSPPLNPHLAIDIDSPTQHLPRSPQNYPSTSTLFSDRYHDRRSLLPAPDTEHGVARQRREPPPPLSQPNQPATRHHEPVVKLFSDTDSSRSFGASSFSEDSDRRYTRRDMSLSANLCGFVVFCIGVAIAVTTLLRVKAGEYAQEDVNCGQLARQISSELYGALSIAQGYSAFVNATGYQNLTSEAFNTFGESSSLKWTLYGTTWVQRVFQSERAAWEAKMGLDIVIGTDRVKSPVRDVYYPITYTYPVRPLVIGFDYYSEEFRKKAMEDAWRAKAITYSTVFNILNYSEGAGILVFFPYHTPTLPNAPLAPGYVLTILRGPDFIQSAIANIGANHFHIRVLVGNDVLYNSYNVSDSGKKGAPFLSDSNYQYERNITTDRDIVWTLECRKTIDPIGQGGVIIILVGFFITITSVIGTRIAVQRFQQARRSARLNAKAKGKALLEFSRLKARAHTVLKTIADPLIVFDTYGRVQQHNVAALALFKCPTAKPGLVGYTASELFVHHSFLTVNRSRTSVSSMSHHETPQSSEKHGKFSSSNKSMVLSEDSTSGDEEEDPMDITDLLSKSGVRELFVRQLNGAPPLLTEANVSKSERGADAATVILLRDVTEQRAAAEELKKTKLEAEKANMEKGVFLAFLCHELRNPLTVILGMTGFLADTELTPTQKDYQTSLAFSAQVMLEIVNDVLDLERGLTAGPKAIEKIPFDLYELIRDVDRVQKVVVQGRPSGVEWALKCTCTLPKLFLGDPTKLRQCFSNLICNSIKFTRKGWINLTVDILSATDGRVDLRFVVEDTGIGVSPEEIPNLLKPYSQANVSIGRTFGGSGLGLSITNNLVQAMGSKSGLVIQSEVGKGTRTWFDLSFDIPPAGAVPIDPTIPTLTTPDSLELVEGETPSVNSQSPESRDSIPGLPPCGSHSRILPLTPPRMPKSRSTESKESQEANRVVVTDAALDRNSNLVLEAKPQATSEQKPAKPKSLHEKEEANPTIQTLLAPQAVVTDDTKLTVLLVEDNAMIQRLGATMLRKEGFNTLTANNGAEAVDVLVKGGVDVCLMDLMMPVMDGFTATAEAINRGIRVPIIALTANAIVADRDRCFQIGFVGYCTKPLGKKEMGQVVRRAYATSIGGVSNIPTNVSEGTNQIFWRIPASPRL